MYNVYKCYRGRKFEQRKGTHESWGSWGAGAISSRLNEKVMVQLELEGEKEVAVSLHGGRASRQGNTQDRGHESEYAQHVLAQQRGLGCRSGRRNGELKLLTAVQKGVL